MGMDRIDAVSIVGVGTLIAASTTLEAVLVAAALGGFALSLASWRLYGGRPWEALAWLAWVVTAVSLVVPLGGAASTVVFFASLLAGLGLLIGARAGLLPDVWTVGDATE
ncbi:hypothetical protein [Natronococcus sp.]|uniref:hypothetical protein n=1 Tax=Natronococcus sp. TaxID=35747 RepID=UPI003A4DB31D